MTAATAMALQADRLRTGRDLETAIRRRRFREAAGGGGQAVLVAPAEIHGLRGLGTPPDAGATGYGPIYKAYRALKLLHD